jgi:hypothetical protein
MADPTVKVLWLDDTPNTALDDILLDKVVARLGNGLDRVSIGATNPGQTPIPTGRPGQTWGQLPRLEWQQRLRARALEAGKSVTIVWGHRVDVLGPPNIMDPTLLDHPEWLAQTPAPDWRPKWRAAGWTWRTASWCSTALWDRVALMKDAIPYTTSADPTTKLITFNGVVANMKKPRYRDWAVEHAVALARALEADELMMGRKGWLHWTGRILTPGDPKYSGIVTAPGWSKLNLEGYYDNMIGRIHEAVPTITQTHPAGSVQWSPTMSGRVAEAVLQWP